MIKIVPIRIVKRYVPSLIRVEEQLNFRRGQTIFYKGHRAYGLYMVRSGKVGLLEKRDGSKTTIKRILGPGDIFGEEALVKQEPYVVSAAALEDSRIVFFPKSVLDFMSHIKRERLRKAKVAA